MSCSTAIFSLFRSSFNLFNVFFHIYCSTTVCLFVLHPTADSARVLFLEINSVIHTINRAQIINDGWNLAKSGELDMNVPLRMLEYLNKEDEYIPWSAAVSELNFVNTMLKRHTLYGKFSSFMLKKLEEPYNRTGLNNTGATHLQSYYRSLIVGQACSYGNKKCRDAAKLYFLNWMETGINTIDPGLKSTVYCTAIEDGGYEEWEFAYNKYKTENLAAEQSRLLSAMSCSKETWILSKYLEMAVDDKGDIRRQDAVSVIVWISRNSVGRALAWDFVRAHFQSLLDKYGGGSFSFSNLISGITESFNTDFELEQLRHFMTQFPNLGAGARAFEQAVEKTKSNIQWMSKNVPIIDKELQL